MRIVRSGAVLSAHEGQTPSVSSAATEPASKAVVRLSALAGRRPTSVVSTPPSASEIAAVRPAGPPPTTMAARLSAFLSGIQGRPGSTLTALARPGRVRKPRCLVAISPYHAMRYAKDGGPKRPATILRALRQPKRASAEYLRGRRRSQPVASALLPGSAGSISHC